MLPTIIKTINDLNKEAGVAGVGTNAKHLTSISTVNSLVSTLSESKFGVKMCSEVYSLGVIYMTVPMTSATAERSFSTMRRIKTYLRQTMSQQRLNHCMLLHIHKDRTDRINMHDVLTSFVEANDDRVRYFGTVAH